MCACVCVCVCERGQEGVDVSFLEVRVQVVGIDISGYKWRVKKGGREGGRGEEEENDSRIGSGEKREENDE